MQHIAFFQSITKKDVFRAGGKGASLGEMTRAHIPVPPGFIILASAFDQFIDEQALKEDIAAQLKKVHPDDMNSVEKISITLRDMIHDVPFPKKLSEEILDSYKQLKATVVAVRSSATAEDSGIASWAGELETYLNSTKDNLLERIKKCWSSLFTPRALFYRYEKKLIDQNVSVAVVIQKMVQSDISGVAFTVHPVTEDPDQMIIEAGYGLGEAIVSGQITPDSYIVSKKKMEILDIAIGNQGKKLVRISGKKGKQSTEESNEWVMVSRDEIARQKLTSKQILAVGEICKKIEKHYRFPCDIEWAVEKGKIYITQSRPITTLHP